MATWATAISGTATWVTATSATATSACRPRTTTHRAVGDLNLETAGALGNAPTGLAATALKKGGILLQWSAPHVGTVVSYDVYRVIGTSITPQNFATRLAIGPIGRKHGVRH